MSDNQKESGVISGMRKQVKTLMCRSLFIAAAAMACMHVSGSFGSDFTGAWRHHERKAPTKTITSIKMLPDGKVVAGTSESFHIYDGESWEKFSYGSPLLTGHVPFFSDAQGRLYFNDSGYLVVWEDGMPTRYDSVELVEPLTVAQSGAGIIYFGSYYPVSGGVFEFDGSTVTRIYDGRVRSLAAGSDGKIWATVIPPDSVAMRFVVFENGEWKDRTMEIETLLPVVNRDLFVQIAPDGAVWVCNRGPYGVFRNETWEFNKNTGEHTPVELCFDRSGRVWGYASRNLYRLDSTGKWVVSWTFESQTPISLGFIASGADSTVFTFDAQYVYRLSGQTWEKVENAFDLGSDTVTCMVYMDDGRLLCGHGVRGVPWEQREKCGLSIYDNGSWYNFNEFGDYEFPDVYCMEKSPLGEIYLYSDNGLFTFDGKSFDSKDTLDSYDITDMAWDQQNKFWLTTGRGLIQLRDYEYDLYIPPAAINPWGGVYNLCIDDDGNLYMQAIYGQVLFSDRSEWSQLIADPGRAINDIAVEGDGTVWGSRVSSLSWWNVSTQEWQIVVDFPDSNRLVKIDEQGRVWASGYGKTGYYENGSFFSFPELAQTASNAIAFAENGRIALNAFNRERNSYYGIEEFIPSSLAVEETEEPISFLTASSYPNPFNPKVTIQFELPSAGPVKITIYNITGQRVKTLADHGFPAGVSRIEWDSLTDSGAEASSGVYFYRIVSGRHTRAGKMLLLR